MKSSQSLLTPHTLASVALIAVVLVFNAITVHRNAVSLHDTHSLAVQSQEVLAQSEQIFRRLVEAESGARGYAITGDDSHLKIYRLVNDSLSDQLRALRASVADNPFLLAQCRVIEDEAKARMELLRLVVLARSDDGFDAARVVVEAGDGKRAMDRIRECVKNLEVESKGLLHERIANADRQLSTILFVNLAGVCLGVLISCISWVFIDRQMRKCREAETIADVERENLLMTLKSIGDAVVVTDSHGNIRLSNAVANELIGVTQELIGKSLDEVFILVNQSNRQSVRNPISTGHEFQKVMSFSDQSLLIRNDGAEIPVEHTTAPIRDRSGEITGFILVFRDCSERWHFEKELLKRERRFRKMFETPLLGIAVGTSDGRALMEANDAYLDLIGYNRGKLLESSLGWGGVIAEQSPLGTSAQKELQETGVCRPFEKVYTRGDGTIVPVLISSTKLFDDEDGIIVFITDLTRAKRSEDALRDSEDRFRILSESMPQMVWMALPDGQFVYVNQTMLQYSGRTVEALTGWGWTELLHREEQEKLIEGWKVALKTGKPLEIEHRLRHVTGEFRWYLTRARPMYGAKEQITRWVGTSTDIHDHKLIETILREEHQRKDRFLALLAHELRNPLAPLANAVQVFASVGSDPIASAELVAIMQRQIKQMTRLMDDLLDIARITQDRIVLRRERIMVDFVIAAAVEAVKPWINERSQQLTATLPPHPLWIDADAARMSQVLTNLLQNAAKYSEPGSQISISVESVGGEVHFRVRDNGAGMSEEMLACLFDQSMRADEIRNRSHGGLGIGLKLVRALVELHGGTVTAHSEGLGRGSDFLVRLPLVVEHGLTPSNKTIPPTADPAAFSMMNVLVVDDVKASAKTLALMLATLGPKVATAFDGRTAIDRASIEAFDIVFLDIAMPGMDGLEVARQIRSNPNLADLWLVALTGFGQDDDRQRSLDAGFNEHIIKPANMILLTDVLQRAAKHVRTTVAEISDNR